MTEKERTTSPSGLRGDLGESTDPAAPVPERRRTQKTSERVALDIVRDIVVQGIRAGDRLPLEASMIEQYHVSRASLREALRLLEMQGLIRLKPGPGGGPVVGSVQAANLARTATLYYHLGAASYRQLLEAQAMLEPLGAELACRHPDRRTALKPFLDAHEPQGESEYRRVTRGFHDVVYRLAGNPVLTLLIHAVTHIVTDQVVATMDPVVLRPTILVEHAELARAIAAGRASKARRLMAAHFEAQHDFYRRHWPARLDELIELDMSPRRL
jgi:GntR family transcriptional repressor for pyruvate dehydrogenase complex